MHWPFLHKPIDLEGMQLNEAHDDCNIRPYGYDDDDGDDSPHVHDDPDDPDLPDDQLENPSVEHFHNRLAMNVALLDLNGYQVKLIYVLCLHKGLHGPIDWTRHEVRRALFLLEEMVEVLLVHFHDHIRR